MPKLNEIYKCQVCGNIVEVVHTGKGTLVCCGQNMDLQEEHFEDKGNEKHVPVVTEKDNKLVVEVGSVPHPMEDKHYIEWIELATASKTYKKFLTPSSKPLAEFEKPGSEYTVRCYCNLHGLWKSE